MSKSELLSELVTLYCGQYAMVVVKEHSNLSSITPSWYTDGGYNKYGAMLTPERKHWELFGELSSDVEIDIIEETLKPILRYTSYQFETILVIPLEDYVTDKLECYCVILYVGEQSSDVLLSLDTPSMDIILRNLFTRLCNIIMKEYILRLTDVEQKYLSTLQTRIGESLSKMTQELSSMTRHTLPRNSIANLSKVMDASEDLTTELNDMLDLGRLIGGFIKIKKSHTNIQILINSCIGILNSKWANVMISTNVNMLTEQEKYMIVDAGKLKNILMTTISYAAEFCTDGMYSMHLNVECLPITGMQSSLSSSSSIDQIGSSASLHEVLQLPISSFMIKFTITLSKSDSGGTNIQIPSYERTFWTSLSSPISLGDPYDKKDSIKVALVQHLTQVLGGSLVINDCIEFDIFALGGTRPPYNLVGDYSSIKNHCPLLVDCKETSRVDMVKDLRRWFKNVKACAGIIEAMELYSDDTSIDFYIIRSAIDNSVQVFLMNSKKPTLIIVPASSKLIDHPSRSPYTIVYEPAAPKQLLGGVMQLFEEKKIQMTPSDIKLIIIGDLQVSRLQIEIIMRNIGVREITTSNSIQGASEAIDTFDVCIIRLSRKITVDTLIEFVLNSRCKFIIVNPTYEIKKIGIDGVHELPPDATTEQFTTAIVNLIQF
jgi:hypothetical protein